MILRRQFLSALGATGLLASPLARVQAAMASTDDLDWRCDVIQTLPRKATDRAPVVTGVSLQPSGAGLAIAGDDHFVCVYDYQQARYLEHIGVHTDWIRAVRFSPDGKTLVTAGNDRTVRFWDASAWGLPVATRTHPDAVIEVAFSPDSRLLATVGFEKTLRIYEVATGNVWKSLECDCADNHAVAFSSDNQRLAAGGRSGAVVIWDVANGNRIGQVQPHRQRIRSLEFIDEHRLVSAGDDQQVRIIDIRQLPNMVKLPRQTAKIFATAMLGPDRLAVAGSDNRVHVWQWSQSLELGTLSGHTGTVSCLDYANEKLVSGSYDTEVRLWHVGQSESAPEQRHTQLPEGWNGRLK